MNYYDLIDTVSEVAENEKIYKKGLTLVYELEPDRHYKMDEHLFYAANPNAPAEDFQHRDEVVIDVGGIQVKFVKKQEDEISV